MDEREERIRARARQIWEEEGRPDGREQEHWERAAREIDSSSEREEAQSGRDRIAGGLGSHLVSNKEAAKPGSGPEAEAGNLNPPSGSPKVGSRT